MSRSEAFNAVFYYAPDKIIDHVGAIDDEADGIERDLTRSYCLALGSILNQLALREKGLTEPAKPSDSAEPERQEITSEQLIDYAQHIVGKIGLTEVVTFQTPIPQAD